MWGDDMKNRWVVMDGTNKDECIALMDSKNLLKVVVNGKDVQTKSVFMNRIGTTLQFPTDCGGKFSRFADWIRDLRWLPSELGVCIWITGFKDLLKEDEKSKRIIEELFKKDVLPFWETEVLKNVKGGKPREFYVIVS